jgi:lipid-A-disaccharide synthase-like uncharacterized protein
MDWHDASYWLAIGFAGNALFFSRFLVQWIASERAGRSYVPVAFWWLSIMGSLVLLVYAIHRRDPVFTLAFLPNCVVYVRNLMLIRKERRARALRADTQEQDRDRAAGPIWPGSDDRSSAAAGPVER